MLLACFFICAFAAGSCCRYADVSQVPVAPPRRRHDIGDAKRNVFSNIEVLLPLIVKGHDAQKQREIHYPNTNAKNFNPNIERHDYITNNLATAHDSREKQTIFIRNGKITKMKSVKKDLKNHHITSIDLLKDIVIKTPKYTPKTVPFKLLKVCNRLLKQTELKSNDIKVEIAVNYCKELLDTLFEKHKSVKNRSNKNSNEEKEITFKVVGGIEKESSKECNQCTRYNNILGNLNGLKKEDPNNLNKKIFLIHMPPVKPLRSFGPYAGRRDK